MKFLLRAARSNGTCFSWVVSNCCDIAEAEDLCFIYRGTRVQRRRLWRLGSLSDIYYKTTTQLSTVTDSENGVKSVKSREKYISITQEPRTS